MSDPLWDNVSLLLRFDGADGATATTDASDAARAVTFHGTAALSTAQSKFGGSSLLIPVEVAHGNYVSVANSAALLDLAGDYSIQFYFRVPDDATVQTGDNGHILSTFHDADGSGILAWYTLLVSGMSRINVQMRDATWDISVDLQSGTVLTKGAWHFVEFTQSGANNYLFINGVLEDSLIGRSVVPANNSPTMVIGGDPEEYQRDAYSNIDEFRITNGATRNASAYTPPTEPYEIGGAPLPEAIISAPSPLVAPILMALNDFSGQVELDNTRYLMRITGDPVLEIPVSSWQATLQTGSQNYLQCVIPAASDYIDLLAARRGASEIVIYRATLAGAVEVESEMARAPLSQVGVNSGPFRETATISGYAPASPDLGPGTTKPLSGVRSSFQSLGGSARVRADVDWFLRPGQSVSANGITLLASYINYFVPAQGDEYMDVGDR
ncbi:MAG TPA: LamG-like jellyroll fold domain-containing protein [Kineobactrum sp.]